MWVSLPPHWWHLIIPFFYTFFISEEIKLSRTRVGGLLGDSLWCVDVLLYSKVIQLCVYTFLIFSIMVYHRILNIALCHPVGPCLSKYKNSQLLTSTSHSAPLPTPLPPTTSLLRVRWFCSTGSFVLYYIYLVSFFFFFLRHSLNGESLNHWTVREVPVSDFT